MKAIWPVAIAAIAIAGCDRTETPVDAPLTKAAIRFDGADATGADRIRHGERISWVLGCHGCHGKGLEGQPWDEDPNGYGMMWASNLTRAIPAMSDRQLKELLLRGKHPSRKEMWSMPSQIFQHISAPDLDALIAYLRTVPPAGEPSPPPVPGPKAYAEIEAGSYKPAAAMVRDPAFKPLSGYGPATEQGAYIASMTCTECHGGQLKGVEGDTPDLVVASGYSREEFERFLTTGVPSGNRKLKNDLMSVVAKSRFAKMTAGERDSLYAFLKARAERPQ